MFGLILTIFKYLTIVLTFGIGTIGMFVDLRHDDGPKKGQLTILGRRVMMATAVCFVAAMVSTALEDIKVRRDEGEKAQLERRITRDIIVSSQPLHSLQIRWTFHHPPPELLAKAKEVSSPSFSAWNAVERDESSQDNSSRRRG